MAGAERLDERERDRYAELFDIAPVACLVTDVKLAITEANTAAAELIGVEARRLSGKPLPLFVSLASRRAFRRDAAAVLRGEELRDRAFQLRGRGGGEVEVCVRARRIVDAAGLVTGASWTIARSDSRPADEAFADALAEADASRQALVAALWTERNRLLALLGRLHQGVATVDSALRIQFANRAAQRLLGATAQRGNPLPDPWEPVFSLRSLAAGLFAGVTDTAEETLALPDGATYRVVALPPASSGEVVLVLEDVSHRDRRERAEREFVANAAHQLRTPVSAIASAIEVLQGGAKDNPEARDRFLVHIDRQCSRLVRLTRSLLLLARAEALDEPPSVELVPLSPLLHHVAAGLHPGEGVEVIVDCPPLLGVLANRDLAEQAIANLAENAAKFTREGQIVLAAGTEDPKRVTITVTDTGRGIGDAERERVIERFYRERAEADGFGLGLAIAREAVRVLGGTLDLESSSSGTTAVLTLPAAWLRTPAE